MKFLVDEQLPPLLAQWLRDGGHDASHIKELGWRAAKDRLIWTEAISQRAVIVSKDEDFAGWRRQGDGPQVLWICTGNTTRDVLITRVDAVWARVLALLEAGEPIVELH